jgi:hypothetical protein
LKRNKEGQSVTNYDKWYKSLYQTARKNIDQEKIDPIEFATALINVSKLILVEEVGVIEAENLFDFANKSFIIEAEKITYH